MTMTNQRAKMLQCLSILVFILTATTSTLIQLPPSIQTSPSITHVASTLETLLTNTTIIIEKIEKININIDATLPPESFRWIKNKTIIHIQAADQRGIIYSIHEIIKQISNQQHIQKTNSQSPAFPRRTFSEQAQLLNLPDVAYYTSTGDMNYSRIISECQTLMSLVPKLHWLRINTLQILLNHIEDVVDYSFLTKATNRPPIYASHDPHVKRANQISTLLNENLFNPLIENNMEGTVMMFEFAFPPSLAQHYNLSVYSPDLAVVIQYKFEEFFQRLPNCTGVLVYVADNWSPRAGYNFSRIWNTPEELAMVANMYFDAVVTASGKQLWFSLWSAYTVSGQVDSSWSTINQMTSRHSDLEFSINIMEGDFMIDHPLNNILAHGGAASRDVQVMVDVQRQYNGWGRAIALPARQWSKAILHAWHQGANSIQGMGPWSESAVWSDVGDELDNNTFVGQVSWAGLYNRYRVLLPPLELPPGGIHGLPLDLGPIDIDYKYPVAAEAHLYVLYGLAWDPTQSAGLLARQWAAITFGNDNADVVASALLISEALWLEQRIPNVDDYALCHATWFIPKFRPDAESDGWGLISMETNTTLFHVQRSNAKTKILGQRLMSYVKQVDRSKVPTGLNVINGQTGDVLVDGLMQAANKSQLFMNTVCDFRELYLLNFTIITTTTTKSKERKIYCDALNLIVSNFYTVVFVNWDKWFPEEASDWMITNVSPKLWRHEYWMTHRGEYPPERRSMVSWVKAIEGDVSVYCGKKKIV